MSDELAELKKQIAWLEGEIECNRASYLMFAATLQLLLRDSPAATKADVRRLSAVAREQCAHPEPFVKEMWRETIDQMTEAMLKPRVQDKQKQPG